MAGDQAARNVADRFDGIVDNKSPTMPRIASYLFVGLILWGVVFSAYYLLSGWSSFGHFEASMKTAQPPATSSPGGSR